MNPAPTPLTDAALDAYEHLPTARAAKILALCRTFERRNAELTAALVWARENLGKHTRPSPIDKALDGVEIPPNLLEKRNAELVAAITNLRDTKGRHNTQIAFDRLMATLAAQEGGEG